MKPKFSLKTTRPYKSHTPVLPGKPLSLKDFKNWIRNAEAGSTFSLNEFKEKWLAKRRQLQQHVNLIGK
jgi:hypothetical protein